MKLYDCQIRVVLLPICSNRSNCFLIDLIVVISSSFFTFLALVLVNFEFLTPSTLITSFSFFLASIFKKYRIYFLISSVNTLCVFLLTILRSVNLTFSFILLSMYSFIILHFLAYFFSSGLSFIFHWATSTRFYYSYA